MTDTSNRGLSDIASSGKQQPCRSRLACHRYECFLIVT
jgi:hypothetical protein